MLRLGEPLRLDVFNHRVAGASNQIGCVICASFVHPMSKFSVQWSDPDRISNFAPDVSIEAVSQSSAY